MKYPFDGKAACTKIKDALATAGLGRTSAMGGAEIRGWTESLGSTGFSVRKERPAEGALVWHIVISGRPHLRYNEQEECRDGEVYDVHDPVCPERLCGQIRSVFESLGLSVLSVRYAGHQRHWDDDVEYEIHTESFSGF